MRVLSFATCARISDRGLILRNAVAPKEVVQDDDSDSGDRGQCSSDGPDAADILPGLGRLPAVSGMAFNGTCICIFCQLEFLAYASAYEVKVSLSFLCFFCSKAS